MCRECSPNGQDIPPLVTSKEYFRDATSHIQRISHLSQQNNTRLAKGLCLHQPLQTKHLLGPQAHIHWQPVAVIEELADDLEEYWKKHKYAVTHRKAVLYPRNDQERAEVNRQHATAQLPLGVRVIELTFAPSQEPLLHLMGEVREDSDEKTITLDYDRLYNFMDTQYLDNISHLQSTRICQRYPAPRRDLPTQMAYHSHTRTDCIDFTVPIIANVHLLTM
jgi:hypothetical protein